MAHAPLKHADRAQVFEPDTACVVEGDSRNMVEESDYVLRTAVANEGIGRKSVSIRDDARHGKLGRGLLEV